MNCRNHFFFFSCVLVLLAASCTGSTAADNPLNSTASLPPAFQFSKKGYKVLTSVFSKKTGTVSMLFGNERATQPATDSTQHPPGAEWALVTWKIAADRHWFGAEIPGELLSVETVVAAGARPGMAALNYSRFSGKELLEQKTAGPETERVRFILGLQPAIFP